MKYENDYKELDKVRHVKLLQAQKNAESTLVKVPCNMKRTKLLKSNEFGLWSGQVRVSVQGVKSLGGHFACLCQGFDFYEVKKILLFFKKKREILLHF